MCRCMYFMHFIYGLLYNNLHAYVVLYGKHVFMMLGFQKEIIILRAENVPIFSHRPRIVCLLFLEIFRIVISVSEPRLMLLCADKYTVDGSLKFQENITCLSAYRRYIADQITVGFILFV
jgi:hypothetical protein